MLSLEKRKDDFSMQVIKTEIEQLMKTTTPDDPNWGELLSLKISANVMESLFANTSHYEEYAHCQVEHYGKLQQLKNTIAATSESK